MSETTAPARFSFTALANPTRYLSYSGKILPWLGGLSALLLIVGLYMAFAAPVTANSAMPNASAQRRGRKFSSQR